MGYAGGQSPLATPIFNLKLFLPKFKGYELCYQLPQKRFSKLAFSERFWPYCISQFTSNIWLWSYNLFFTLYI